MKAAAGWTLALLLGTVALSGALAPPAMAATASSHALRPCKDGQDPDPKQPCTGPVDNASGGGGGALTIGVSIVVGLAVAGVAFVLVRRQLAKPPVRGGGPDRIPRPDPNGKATP
jgi:hypothetical protein